MVRKSCICFLSKMLLREHPESDSGSWELVYSSPERYRVEILKGILEVENIPSVIINKQDSAYVVIGEIELYVTRENAFQASQLITQFIENE